MAAGLLTDLGAIGLFPVGMQTMTEALRPGGHRPPAQHRPLPVHRQPN